MNKHSNNFMAEQILKSMGAIRYGRPGSTEKGIRVIKNYLSSIGVPQNSYIIENGSGLSSKTRLTSRQLVNVLVDVYNNASIRPEFTASIPIIGIDGTTKRWKISPAIRGYARAKTGTLAGVSALAGYVPMKNGRMAAFAIIANGLKSGMRSVHRAEASVVDTISGIDK